MSLAKSRNCLAEVTRRGAVVLFTDFIVRVTLSISHKMLAILLSRSLFTG